MSKLVKGSRVSYLDNIRVFLTVLVVLHHWAIANGSPGDWYFTDSNLSAAGYGLLGIFIATNQAFFMGLFFFISAYFLPASYNKKGGRKFLKDRFIRLGIPLLFYIFILSPMVKYTVAVFGRGYSDSLAFFLLNEKGIFDQGPLWFVELLLIFNLCYYLFRQLNMSKKTFNYTFKKGHIFILLVILIVTSFVVRIEYPVGKWIPILNIQPGHLPQYILFFLLGLQAKKLNFLEMITPILAKRTFLLANILVLAGLPLVILISGAIDNFDSLMGGASLNAFLFSFWEQLLAVCMSVGVLGIFKYWLSEQSTILKNLAQESYAVYIFHPLLIVLFSLVFLSFSMDSLVKFIVLAPLLAASCFYFAKFVRKIKWIRNII